MLLPWDSAACDGAIEGPSRCGEGSGAFGKASSVPGAGKGALSEGGLGCLARSPVWDREPCCRWASWLSTKDGSGCIWNSPTVQTIQKRNSHQVMCNKKKVDAVSLELIVLIVLKHACICYLCRNIRLWCEQVNSVIASCLQNWTSLCFWFSKAIVALTAELRGERSGTLCSRRFDVPGGGGGDRHPHPH